MLWPDEPLWDVFVPCHDGACDFPVPLSTPDAAATGFPCRPTDLGNVGLSDVGLETSCLGADAADFWVAAPDTAANGNRFRIGAKIELKATIGTPTNKPKNIAPTKTNGPKIGANAGLETNGLTTKRNALERVEVMADSIAATTPAGCAVADRVGVTATTFGTLDDPALGAGAETKAATDCAC